MKNKVDNGQDWTVTATGAFSSGDIWIGTDRCGIHSGSGVTGDQAVVALTGSFSVTKATGIGEGLTVGDKVYAKATGGSNIASATGTTPLGYSQAVVATGTATAIVTLGTF